MFKLCLRCFGVAIILLSLTTAVFAEEGALYFPNTPAVFKRSRNDHRRFKALKLGKVIGNETYRWLIFTSGKGLVDGSFYALPSWGCYTLDGKDIEWHSVKPDIYIKNTLKDRLEGKDPQSDAAIEEIMPQLKNK